MKFTWFLLFVLICTQLVHADERRDFDRAVLQLQTQTVVDLLAEELAQEGVMVKDVPVDEDALATHLELKAGRFAPHAVFKQAAHWIVSEAHKIRTEARLLGVDVGLVTVVAVLCNNVMPIILTAIGLPGPAAAVLVLPSGALIGAGYAGMKSLLYRKKIIAMYGGPEKYRHYMALKASARRALHVHRDTDLMSNEDVVFSNDGWFGSFLRPRQDLFTFRALKKIAMQNGFTREQVKRLKHNVDDNSARASFLYLWLEQNLTSDQMNSLHADYAKSFIHPSQHLRMPSLMEWAADANDVKTCDDLEILALRSPDGVAVPFVVETWEQVVLPRVAQTFSGIQIQPYYKMMKRMRSLEILGRLAETEVWNQKWRDELSKTLSVVCD